MLVGDDAAERLGAQLDPRFSYRIDVRTEAMPWSDHAEVALAVPEDHAD